jgi:hypothetical protein
MTPFSEYIRWQCLVALAAIEFGDLDGVTPGGDQIATLTTPRINYVQGPDDINSIRIVYAGKNLVVEGSVPLLSTEPVFCPACPGKRTFHAG